MTPDPQFDILLVDDSPSDAKIFQAALEEAATRATVYWVASGEEALDFLNRQGRFSAAKPVKLVVLDVNMPGVDGLETLRRIKSAVTTNHVPVVLFSSAKALNTVDLAYALGANAYFSKPLSLESYIVKIRTLVEHWLVQAELPSAIHSPNRLYDQFITDEMDSR